MSATPPPSLWRTAIAAAEGGNYRLILELLLQPSSEDETGQSFWALPDDQGLRIDIVLCLLAGPLSTVKGLKTTERAEFLGKLFTHVGHGEKKKAVHPVEIGFAEFQADLLRHFRGASEAEIDDALQVRADALGIDLPTLKRRIADRRKKPTRKG